MSQAIRTQKIVALAEQWLAEGGRVVGPVAVKPGVVLYRELASASELRLDSDVRPANSLKEIVFPYHEPLYRYRFEGKQVQILETPVPQRETVVIGARPCDAAALAILDHVFNASPVDEQYNQRRRQTTVVTVACRQPDIHCFCTSVGSGPDDPAGSDAMLFDLGEGTFEARVLSDKGRRSLAGALEPSQGTAPACPPPLRKIDLEAVRAVLAEGFERKEWAAAALRCLGCGACAYGCPTCHCFDVVDEGDAAGGVRVRNWDACQFPLFTLHASGHNPRGAQWQRQRQRIYHKFQVYPDKFGPSLCTGCGNCTRNCPVGLGVFPVLQQLERMAANLHVES